MSNLPKLDTYADVVKWVRSKSLDGPIDWHDDTCAVASYLAECVKLRQEWDVLADTPPTNFVEAKRVYWTLRGVMQGDTELKP